MWPGKEHTNIFQKYLIDISNYSAIKKIEAEGINDVYIIKDERTNIIYIAKILVLESTQNEQDRNIIKQEIINMIRLQHPTLNRFYGYSMIDFLNKNNVTFIMNYAENGSLASVFQSIQKGSTDIKIDNTIRQKILIGIARGMMYLHQNGIIYRNLKPANILLDSKYHPHISDFFLSNIHHNDSPIYNAPEIIRGERYNNKVDVYSFGILMFEIITNTIAYPLFQNGQMTVYELNNQIIQENYRPEFTSMVKSSLKNLIIQCWSPEPKNRPTFKEIFNKLAFNLDDTLNDITSNEEIFKFYLDDVDVEEVLNYSYEITELENKDKEVIEQLKRDKTSIESELKNQKELIDNFISKNEQLKKEKNEIENVLKNHKGIIEDISIQNQQLKKDKIEIENELKRQKELNENFSTENEQLKIEKIEYEKQLKNHKELIEDLYIEKEMIKDKIRQNKEMVDNLIQENIEIKNQLFQRNQDNLKEEEKIEKNAKILSFQYEEGKEFSGIIKYLTNETGGNIHDNGTIEISSNSIFNSNFHPKNLLNSDSNIYEAKNGERYATVVFDFKNMEIEISKYTIKSCSYEPYEGHIKNWVIEISNNLNDWTVIDEHVNSNELNDYDAVETFSVAQLKFARYCRFRHTGDYWGYNDFAMGLSSIEFYGRLV